MGIKSSGGGGKEFYFIEGVFKMGKWSSGRRESLLVGRDLYSGRLLSKEFLGQGRGI